MRSAGERKLLAIEHADLGPRNKMHGLGPEHLTELMAGALSEHDHVEPALLNAFEQQFGGLAGHLDENLGMRFLKRCQDLGQEADRVIVRHAEPNGSRQVFLREIVEDLGIDPQQAPRAGIELIAFRRQRDAPAFAHEKGMTEALFEPLDLHRDGRLGLVHPAGRFGEAPTIGNGGKGLKLVEVERRGHIDHQN